MFLLCGAQICNGRCNTWLSFERAIHKVGAHFSSNAIAVRKYTDIHVWKKEMEMLQNSNKGRHGSLVLRCCGVVAACLFFTRGSASSPRNTQQGLLAEGTRLTTSAFWAVVVECGPDGVATPPHRRGGPATCRGLRAGACMDRQQNSRDIGQSFAAAQSRVRWSPIAFGTRCQRHRPMGC